ncbi:transporter substrate-binding domain-containing protein [Legionella impletisoli]|uniref:Arginine ABC transporter substrate-binding protein n=1 Tax=Legionella impletisoli TaxID=343510 RepID=A0A917N8G0_9GAMM|nr:transporter substrate-binding domain-containing protein [Legionella impletisoli]GGI77453.1 arginine ABC transporter substrate-binding protein [Legionella impletisoli]
MNSIKRWLNRLVLLAFILSHNACFAGAPQQVVIGTISYNPPFELMTNEQYSGFEIEIMREVCLRVRMSCKFQTVLFHQIPEFLNENKIDLGLAALIITPAREENFLFSTPYKVSNLQFMTLANSTIKSVDKLQNKTIGAYKDSPSTELIHKILQNKVTIKTYETSMDMLSALDNQEVKAIITNPEQATYWVANSDRYQLVGQKYPFGDGYGMMATKKQTDLIEKINHALTDMENDGTLLKIYNEWL